MRTVHFEHRYPCGPDRLYDLLTDRDHVLAQRRSSGAEDVELVTYEADDAGVELAYSEVQRPPLPGFAMRVLPAEARVTQRETWRCDGRTARWENVTAALPGTITGTMEVAADGDGAVHRLEARIEVKVPIIGGKIEGFIAGRLEGELAEQAVFHEAALAGG